MNTQEKASIQADEVQEIPTFESIHDTEAQGWCESATKRLLRRLDWHILPFMSLIYL
jgi:hypothetical protein